MSDKRDQIYCSFLLRIWIEPEDGNTWRFSLEDTRTGYRKGFANIETLVAHLQELLRDGKGEE